MGFDLLDEFGSGSDGTTSCNRDYYKNLEPFIQGLMGGSSTGSAYSVFRDYSDVSICTDTGGSAALPCLLLHRLMQKATEPRENFLISLKFTNNGVSRFGLISLSQSLDCPANIGKDIDMVVKTAEAISSKKEYDYTIKQKTDSTFADAMLQTYDSEIDDIEKYKHYPQ